MKDCAHSVDVHRTVPDSSEAVFSPEDSLEFPQLVFSPWLCSDGAERPADRPVCGDSLDLPSYDEVRGTRYCGFDPSQSQWISVIFLAFSWPECGIVLRRSVGYNVFGPWAPPDSKNRSIPADQIKWCTYYVNSRLMLLNQLTINLVLILECS